MQFGTLFVSMTELGLGDFPGLSAGRRLQGLHAFYLACSCSRGCRDCGDVDIYTHS